MRNGGGTSGVRVKTVTAPALGLLEKEGAAGRAYAEVASAQPGADIVGTDVGEGGC